MVKKNAVDLGLLLVVLFLLVGGIIMVFSASYYYSFYNYNDGYFFLKKQLFWAVIGLGGMFFMANYKYHRLERFATLLLAVTAVLLLMVLIPGVGMKINGARRWIGAGFLSFQPSELAKIAIILFLSSSLAKRKDILKYFWNGLLPYLVIIGGLAGLIIIEPHLSSTVIVFGVGAILLFVAGAKITHFIGLGGAGLAGVITAIVLEPYRLERIYAFLDPWNPKFASKESFQVVQSLMAIGSGGIIGLGLGASKQKNLYIPEPHNDFVFSIIGEELGFLGAAVVLMLFLIFIWKGIKIAVHAPDMFGSLMATGITSLIAFQVMINVAVVTSSMPVTGQPLPFFSAGGTSLVFLLFSVGILLNISRYVKYDRG